MNVGTKKLTEDYALPGPGFWFWYMNLEGMLHTGICLGAIFLSFVSSSNRKAARLYIWSLLSEVIVMDLYYFGIYTVVLLDFPKLVRHVIEHELATSSHSTEVVWA